MPERRICSDDCLHHEAHEVKIKKTEEDIDILFSKFRNLGEGLLKDIQSEIKGKLSQKIFFILLGVIVSVLMAFSGGIWSIKSDLHNGMMIIQDNVRDGIVAINNTVADIEARLSAVEVNMDTINSRFEKMENLNQRVLMLEVSNEAKKQMETIKNE